MGLAVTIEGQEIKAAIRELDRRVTQQIDDVSKDFTKQIDALSKDVAASARFQNAFEGVTKTLKYILGIVSVAAIVYTAFGR